MRIEPVSDIDDAISLLAKLRTRLVIFGQASFIATAAHFIVVLATFGRILLLSYGIAISFIMLALAAGAALVFESLRKRGHALFEEISDEFQWHVADTYRAMPMPTNATDEPPRPPLRYRVELRSFARSSDLPLTPGAYGPAVYVTINILMVASLVIWSYMHRFA